MADDLLPRFLDRFRASPKGDVGGGSVVISLHHIADDAERFDDLDTKGANPGAAIHGHTPGGKDRMLDTLMDDRKRPIDNASVRIVTHGRPDEKGPITLVAIEPIAVVVVRVRGQRLSDGSGRLVDRIVVKAA